MRGEQHQRDGIEGLPRRVTREEEHADESGEGERLHAGRAGESHPRDDRRGVDVRGRPGRVADHRVGKRRTLSRLARVDHVHRADQPFVERRVPLLDVTGDLAVGRNMARRPDGPHDGEHRGENPQHVRAPRVRAASATARRTARAPARSRRRRPPPRASSPPGARAGATAPARDRGVPEWARTVRSLVPQATRAATHVSTTIIASMTASTYCQMCCRSSVSCACNRAPAWAPPPRVRDGGLELIGGQAAGIGFRRIDVDRDQLGRRPARGGRDAGHGRHTRRHVRHEDIQGRAAALPAR